MKHKPKIVTEARLELTLSYEEVILLRNMIQNSIPDEEVNSKSFRSSLFGACVEFTKDTDSDKIN